MCGIAGVVHRDGAISPDPSAALVRRAGAPRPRWLGRVALPAGDALLVHPRLAIIDPGPAGAQPMATPDGRHHIVFNGEVYNYRELRADSRRVANGSPPPATPKCCCASGAATVRRAGAGPRHVRARLLGRLEAVAARGPRSLRHQAALRRRRPTGSIAFASEIQRADARRGSVERDDRSGRRARISRSGAPCRRR